MIDRGNHNDIFNKLTNKLEKIKNDKCLEYCDAQTASNSLQTLLQQNNNIKKYSFSLLEKKNRPKNWRKSQNACEIRLERIIKAFSIVLEIRYDRNDLIEYYAITVVEIPNAHVLQIQFIVICKLKLCIIQIKQWGKNVVNESPMAIKIESNYLLSVKRKCAFSTHSPHNLISIGLKYL